MEQLQPIRDELERGGTALGARVDTFAPEIIEVYGDLGLDYAWLDFEHGGPSAYDSKQLAAYVRAAATADIDLMVRLPHPEPALVRRVLDAGVRTILIPRVETAADLRPAVEASRFRLDGAVGDRGIGGERSSSWGELDGAYTEREDESVMVGAMIENRDAVANLEEILSVSGLGFTFVGPADLSVSLGHPMQTDHPEVREAVETIRETVLDSDVHLGRIADGGAEAANAVANGYRILRIGGEISAVRQVLGERLARFDGER